MSLRVETPSPLESTSCTTVHQLHLQSTMGCPQARRSRALLAPARPADVLRDRPPTMFPRHEAGPGFPRLHVGGARARLPRPPVWRDELAFHVLARCAPSRVGHWGGAMASTLNSAACARPALQVELAHPRDDRCAAGVRMHAEGGVFLGKFLQRDGELSGRPWSGSMRPRFTGSGNSSLEKIEVTLIAQRVPVLGVFSRWRRRVHPRTSRSSRAVGVHLSSRPMRSSLSCAV